MDLDGAVRDLLALLQAQQVTHGGIRVDGVALGGVLQLVRSDIGGEGAGNIRGGHLRALRLAQERAQRVLQGNRGGKDGRALLLRHAVLISGLNTALALASLLDILGNALLEALQGLDGGDGLVTLGLEGLDQILDLLINGLDLNGRLFSSNGGGNRRGGDGGGNRRSGGGRLSGLLRGSGDDGGGDRLGDGLRLLGNLLGGGGGGGGNGLAHCISTGGSICGN